VVQWPRRLASLVAAVAGVAVVSFGCDGGGGAPPARGFGSRQLVATRDQTLRYWTVAATNGNVIYRTGGGNSGQPTEYWALDLGSGAVHDLGSTLPPDLIVPPTNARYACTVKNGPQGTMVLDVTDTQTGSDTTIDSYYSSEPACPLDDDPTMIVWRTDPSGHFTLYTGPYNALVATPLALDVQYIQVYDRQTAIVMGVPPGQTGSGVGLYTVDLTTFDVSEQVPPLLGASAAWAAGATPEGELASSSMVIPSLSPTLQSIGQHYAYERTMADGATTQFVGPITSGSARELALFRIDGAVDQISLPRYYSYIPPSGADGGSGTIVAGSDRMAWQQHGVAAGGQDLVLLWDEGQDRVIPCPAPTSTLLTGDTANGGSPVAFVASNSSSSQQLATGPLLLMYPERAGAGAGDGTGACLVLASQDVASTDFSGDGARVLWWTVPANAPSELWVAASDGSGARRLGTGDISDPVFANDTQILLGLGRDLVWVDATADPATVHSVVEQVFDGPPLALTDVWVLAGYELNEQDGTGTLGLVNWQTDEKRLISNTVAWYQFVSLPDSNFGVLYFVRGRNPSPQDGLWLATITMDDLR
jgi:hypothetical protein